MGPRSTKETRGPFPPFGFFLQSRDSPIRLSLLCDRLFAVLTIPLVVLSFPPYRAGYLAWLALVPLLSVLRSIPPGKAFLTSYAVSIPFLMGIFHWINGIAGFTWIDFLGLGIYFGAYYAAFGGLFSWVGRNTACPTVLSAPAIWVSMEYLRSHAGFLSLPWGLMGHTQYESLPVIQIASIGGAYSVSFLVVMVNAVLADIVATIASGKGIRSRSRPAISSASAFALMGVAAVFLYGTAVLIRPAAGRAIAVSAIQGNIPQGIKWDPAFREAAFLRHCDLTRRATAAGGIALVAWPETAIPRALNADPYLLRRLSSLAKEQRVYILAGSAVRAKIAGKGTSGAGPGYNSAFLISPDGLVAGVYRKIRLLPFGEYLPWKGVLPWPERIVVTAGNFLPGKEASPLAMGDVPIASPICWETIFPDLFRVFVERGALMAVNITNEAWFGESAAPEQFLSMNVFRAVENGISLVRAANTGISCAIDPTGRILGRVSEGGKDIFVEGYLNVSVPLRNGRTIYTRFGDAFAFLAAAISSVLVAVSAWRGIRGKRGPKTDRA